MHIWTTVVFSEKLEKKNYQVTSLLSILSLFFEKTLRIWSSSNVSGTRSFDFNLVLVRPCAAFLPVGTTDCCTELLLLPRLKQIYLKKALFSKYHKIASSRPVYYSILKSFGQRSQYISIKFLLHKQSENPIMCY